jgi:hypothetical protein
MAVFITSTGCGDATPCTNGCSSCGWGGTVAAYDQTFDVTGNFEFAGGLDIQTYNYQTCDWPTGRDFSYKITVYANSVIIYQSECLAHGIGTQPTVPAGTTSIRIVIATGCQDGECESGGTAEWLITCV